MKTITIFLLITKLLISNCIYSQSVSGLLIDNTTQQRIPFVTIYSPDAKTGTLSNENGEFEIRVRSFPVQLVISHISFRTDTITFAEPTDNYFVRLKPSTHELSPVTVSNAGYKLIKRAVDQVSADKSIIYGKAFYRQLSKNGEQHTEIQEIIYSVKLSSSKIEGVKIDNARYAKLPTDSKKLYFTFVNFSYFVLAQKAIGQSKPTEKSVLFPVRSDVVDYYNVRITDIIEQSNGEKVVELDCRIREDYTNPAFSGKVYINTTNYKLVKVQGTIPNSLGAEINDAKMITGNHVYAVDVDYTSTANTAVFSNIRVMYECDQLIRATGEKRKVKISAFLLINELNNVLAKGKYKPIDIRSEDLKLIQRAKYDPEFWRTNPVVKRTPLEESTIKAFEQQDIIGNMKFDAQ